MTEKKRLIVADKHEIITAGLAYIFRNEAPQLQIIENVNCFSDLVQKTLKTNIDCLLLDLELNDGNCLHKIPELLSINPKLKILLFINQEDEQIHLHALRLGVSGIILKTASIHLLIRAVNQVCNDQLWFERSLTQLVLQQRISDNDEVVSILNDKERTIACLAAKGLSAKIIAEKLFLNEKTIRNNLTTIYSKLSVKNQVALCFKFSQFPFCYDKCSKKGNCPEKQDKCPDKSRIVLSGFIKKSF